MPLGVIPRCIYASVVVCEHEHRHDHEQRVVVQDPVLVQIFGVQFFLHIEHVAGSKNIVQHAICVAGEIEGKVAGSCDDSSKDHHVHGHLYRKTGLNTQDEVFADHGHEDAETPQGGEHW